MSKIGTGFIVDFCEPYIVYGLMELSTSDSTQGLSVIVLLFAFVMSIWAIIMFTSDSVSSYMDYKEQVKLEEQRRKERGKVTPRHLDTRHVHGYQVRY